MMYGLSFFVILMMCTVPAHAITREAAVNHALNQSEAMKMARQSANVLQEEGNRATAFAKPQIDFRAGYTEMGTDAADNPYYPTPDRDISATIEAGQLIYAGNRIRTSFKIRTNLFRQADFLLATGKRDIAGQVRLAFDTVLFQRASVAILEDRVAQRENELADARDLKDVGMVTSLDVRQAMLSRTMAMDALEAGRVLYKESLVDFNLAIGGTGGGKLLIPEGDLRQFPDIPSLLGRLNAALESKALLDVETANARMEAARLNHRMARGESFPELGLFSSGKSAGETADDMDRSWNIGIQMQWNLLDGGNIRAKKAAARAEMKKETENLKSVKKRMAGEIEKIGINLRSLKQRITMQQEAVKLSARNYEDARGQYRAGTITLTRLGEFNLSYSEARFNLPALFFLQREQVIRAMALLETGEPEK